jgi:hypothetical protein
MRGDRIKVKRFKPASALENECRATVLFCR